MTDLLKDDCDSWLLDQRQVNQDRNYGLDTGKYEWCPGCREQVANCRCEAIRIAGERIKAWSRFQDALWTSEGIAEARTEVEAMGFAESDIEASIKQIAAWRLQDEERRRTEWFHDG